LREDVVPDPVGARGAVHRGALLDALPHDVRDLVIGVDADGAHVERVDEAQRDEEPEGDLHGCGKYTQIFAAAGSPSVIVCPSLAAVIVPAHGATSVIFRRRPGRTSCFQRCSSSFLSASASSVMRSTTTVAPSLAWASGNGSTRVGFAMPGIGLPCGHVL